MVGRGAEDRVQVVGSSGQDVGSSGQEVGEAGQHEGRRSWRLEGGELDAAAVALEVRG